MEYKIESILNKYEVFLEQNDFFDNPIINIPVYVINLDKDIYRRAYIKYIMNKMKINYTLVIVKPCTDEIKDLIDKNSSNGIVGCFLSHLWCIKHAIEEKKNDYFLIFEDDIVFHKNFLNFFKQLDYTKYDMLQLGCCDFNLRQNMKSENLNNNLIVYNPQELALGAYGNIYNINFAKIVLYEKLYSFIEFDQKFNMYYTKYNIGICYPNLITAELSTSNLSHNYSLFKTSTNLNLNNYYVSRCFYKFDYKDYYFIWIVFIQKCYEYYEKTKNFLNIRSYYEVIDDFSSNNDNSKDIIFDVLTNNDIYFYDLNTILEFLINDNINLEKIKEQGDNAVTEENVIVNEEVITENVTQENEIVNEEVITENEVTENVIVIEEVITENVIVNEEVITENVTENVIVNEEVITENVTENEEVITENVIANEEVITENVTENVIVNEEVITENVIVNEEVITENVTVNEEVITENVIVNEEVITENVIVNEEVITENVIVNEEVITENVIVNEEIITENEIVNEEVITENVTENVIANEEVITENEVTENIIVNEEVITENETQENVITNEEVITEEKVTENVELIVG
jgi:GR25 family glycosyltransferase involved in LPS biosynthesis